MGLQFTIAAGPRPHSHSQVRLPSDSWPHFTVSHSRLPQPGGPGPRIYIPQEQGGQVIPPGTGFPFHRLLRLAGLRWRCSTLPPHGIWLQLGWWPRYITPWHGPRIKHRFQQFFYFCARTRCSGHLFVSLSLPSNGSTKGRAVAQRLDAGFPPRRPGFAYGQHVGFVVDKAALG
jgi:hypothetical protein